jgi:hypothetical protein
MLQGCARKFGRKGFLGMVKSPKSKDDQHREFVKAARELGTDESEETFDKVLKRIAKAPPPKSVQKRKKAKR